MADFRVSGIVVRASRLHVQPGRPHHKHCRRSRQNADHFDTLYARTRHLRLDNSDVIEQTFLSAHKQITGIASARRSTCPR
jgi:hypothetical protein